VPHWQSVTGGVAVWPHLLISLYWLSFVDSQQLYCFAYLFKLLEVCSCYWFCLGSRFLEIGGVTARGDL